MPDPKSPGEILSDPQFQSFPLGDQLKIMRKADPNFAAMNFKDQGTVIAKSRQKSLGLDKIGEKPKDAGFFSTLGHDIASIPGSLIATGTGEPGDTRKPGIIPSIGAAQHAEFEKGREALKNKDYPGVVSGYLAGAIPVVGPMISEIGTEAGLGQYGEAAAHALELAAPAALKEVPVGKLGKAIKAGAKGYREATKGTESAAATAESAATAEPAAAAAGSGNAALKSLADRIPKVHPVAKFLATIHMPGAGTVLHVLDEFKKRYGSDLSSVPKETQHELFMRVYKEEMEMEPDAKLTGKQELDAIKEARAYLKGKPAYGKPAASGTSAASPRPKPARPAGPATEPEAPASSSPPAGTAPADEGSPYGFTHPKDSIADLQKQVFSRISQIAKKQGISERAYNLLGRERFEKLYGHGISTATDVELQQFNKYIAKNGKLPDAPGVK